MRSIRVLNAGSLACLLALAASGGFVPGPDATRPIELRLDGNDARSPSTSPESTERDSLVSWPDWIELRLPLLCVVHVEPRDAWPVDEAPRLALPVLRELPTIELLRSIGYSNARRPFRVELPFDGDLEHGQYLRDDDVIRSPVAIDRELLVKWSAADRIRLEAGYWITYMSSEGATPSYLRHGPCAGVVLEF